MLILIATRKLLENYSCLIELHYGKSSFFPLCTFLLEFCRQKHATQVFPVYVDSKITLFATIKFCPLLLQVDKMTELIKDVHDWYRDLLDNKSGACNFQFPIIILITLLGAI